MSGALCSRESSAFLQKNFGYEEGDFEQANEYYSRAITIPLFPKMTDEEQLYVIETVNTLTVR